MQLLDPGAAPSAGRNQARRPSHLARRCASQAGPGSSPDSRRQLGTEQGALVQHADAAVLDPPDPGRDGVGALVEVGQELLQVGDRRRLDLVEGGQVGAVRAQQPLQLAVELLGVAPQRLEVALELR